jgi:hypothetical protein
VNLNSYFVFFEDLGFLFESDALVECLGSGWDWGVFSNRASGNTGSNGGKSACVGIATK